MGVDRRIPSVYDTEKGVHVYTKIYQYSYGKAKEYGKFIGRRMEDHEPALGAREYDHGAEKRSESGNRMGQAYYHHDALPHGEEKRDCPQGRRSGKNILSAGDQRGGLHAGDPRLFAKGLQGKSWYDGQRHGGGSGIV